MKKNNIALITALYNVKDANFYREIYFPVIKYSITRLFIESPENQKYGDITELQEKIETWFGIRIPLVVLRKSLIALSKTKDDVIIKSYDKQNYYSIERVWDTELKDDIDTKAEKVRELFSRLTISFNQYLESKGLTSQKSFPDLLVKYSNESIALFEKTTPDLVAGEEFSNMALFLQWIRKNDEELFVLVEQILWSSIIAGFLSRKDIDFDTKVENQVTYYLDSALVFAILELSSVENANSVRDMLRIVREAGCVLKVHPITIREVKNVLLSVEKEQGPRHDSEMEGAYVRRQMKLSDILHFRTHLEHILDEEYQIAVSPTVNDQELDSYVNKYRGNHKVRNLYLQRESSSDDTFREIHDVFMSDFVSEKNSNYGLAEKYEAYFVTTNSDFAEFCRPEVKATSVITPSQVVMNLWLHSTQSSKLKLSVLTEMISRSMALNQTFVRRKLKHFNSHYATCIQEPGDLEAMYQSLVYRSNKVLTELDLLAEKEREDGGTTDGSLQIAKQVIEFAREEQKRRVEAESRESARNQVLLNKLREIKSQMMDAQEKSNASEEQLHMINKLEEQNREFQRELERRDKETQLRDRLKEVQARKQQLDNLALDSVSYVKYWLCIIGEFMGMLLVLVAIVTKICHYLRPEFNIGRIEHALDGISLITFVLLWIRAKNMYLFSPRVSKHKIKKEQIDFWKENHEEYASIEKKEKEIEAEIESLRLI